VSGFVLGSACVLAAAAHAKPGEAEATLTIALPPDGARQDEQARALEHGQRAGKSESPDFAQVGDDEARAKRLPSAGAGLAGTFGRVFTEHTNEGWFGRLELEAFTAGAFESHGPLGGALIGGELWLAHDAGGGGLPMSFFFGYRSPGFFISFGAGFDLFEVDEVQGDTGFGIYAPFGTARIGLELGGVRLLADGRAIYRWQWGADDRAQIQVGVTMVPFSERPLPKRVEEGGRAPSPPP
jgi:hypothetical protein